MSFVFSTTIKKSRKTHYCEAGCGVTIPKGFSYIRTFDADGGRGRTSKWHVECREAFDEGLSDAGEVEGDPWATWENGMPEEIAVKYRGKECL